MHAAEELDDVSSEVSSLFGSDDSVEGCSSRCASDSQVTIAREVAPAAASGLFLFPTLLVEPEQDAVVEAIVAEGYFDAARDQVMLFESSDAGRLPAWTTKLIRKLESALAGRIPSHAFETLFGDTQNERRLRQLIINTYRPGQGIASHVDLLNRFGDGVIICSFLSGISMDLEHEAHGKHAVWLSPGSALLLTKEARYEWKHGIAARGFDVLERTGTHTIPRQHRLSVTIRWMLPGGEVLGTDSQSSLRNAQGTE